MKQILFLLALLIGASVSQAQSIYYMRYDTVYIAREGRNGELVLLNATRDTVGILANTGNGRTKFMKSRALNDSTLIIGPDTVRIVPAATNGLSTTDGAVRLGGELDEETTISGSHILNFTNTRVYANKLLLNANLVYPVPTGYGNNSNNPPSLIVYDSARVGLVLGVKASGAPIQFSYTNANAAVKIDNSTYNRDAILVQQVTAQSAGGYMQYYIATTSPRTMAGQVNGGVQVFNIAPAGTGLWGYNYVPTLMAPAGFKSGVFAGYNPNGYRTGDQTLCNDTSLFQVNAGGTFVNFQNLAQRGLWQPTDSLMIVVRDSTLPRLGRTYKGTPFEGTPGYIQLSNSRTAMSNSVIFQTSGDHLRINPEHIPVGAATDSALVWDATDSVVKKIAPTNSSGEYTPTVTAVSNLDVVTIQSAHYYRTGSMCIVYISFTADPTSAAECVFGVSLPIASNLAASSEVIGNGNAAGAGAVETVAVNGDTSNNRANVTFIATADSSRSYIISFSYKITPP